MTKKERAEMVLVLIFMIVVVLVTFSLMYRGMCIMSGTIVPETYYSLIELFGAITLLLGAWILTFFFYLFLSADMEGLRKRIRKLEDELYGMDQEAEEEE